MVGCFPLVQRPRGQTAIREEEEDMFILYPYVIPCLGNGGGGTVFIVGKCGERKGERLCGQSGGRGKEVNWLHQPFSWPVNQPDRQDVPFYCFALSCHQCGWARSSPVALRPTDWSTGMVKWSTKKRSVINHQQWFGGIVEKWRRALDKGGVETGCMCMSCKVMCKVSAVDEQKGYCRLLDTSTLSAQRGWWSFFSYASVRGLYPMFAKEWKCVRARKEEVVHSLLLFVLCPTFAQWEREPKQGSILTPSSLLSENFTPVFLCLLRYGWYWTAKE